MESVKGEGLNRPQIGAEIMRNTIKIIGILALFILIGSIIIAGDLKDKSSTKKLKEEVSLAWKERKGTELIWEGEKSVVAGAARYYGRYEGAVVFCLNRPLPMGMNITVAGERFKWGNIFLIFAYQDDEFYTLEEAYEQGVLTQDHVKQIAETHSKYREMDYAK